MKSKLIVTVSPVDNNGYTDGHLGSGSDVGGEVRERDFSIFYFCRPNFMPLLQTAAMSRVTCLTWTSTAKRDWRINLGAVFTLLMGLSHQVCLQTGSSTIFLILAPRVTSPQLLLKKLLRYN